MSRTPVAPCVPRAEKASMGVGVGLQFSCAAVLHLSHRALAALGGFRKDREPGLSVVKEAFVGRLEAGRW